MTVIKLWGDGGAVLYREAELEVKWKLPPLVTCDGRLYLRVEGKNDYQRVPEPVEVTLIE